MQNSVKRENCSLGCEVCLAYAEEMGKAGHCGLITVRELLNNGQNELAKEEMFGIIEMYEQPRISYNAWVEPGRVGCRFGFDIGTFLDLIELTGATLNGHL